jgi:hypothetical protein
MSGSSPAQDATIGPQELRQRITQDPSIPRRAEDEGAAQEAVSRLNEAESTKQKPEGEKKTFGRTPDGTGKFALPPELFSQRRVRGPSRILTAMTYSVYRPIDPRHGLAASFPIAA